MNVLNQKQMFFFSMGKFFVHIEITAKLKNSQKIGRQSSKLIHLLK